MTPFQKLVNDMRQAQQRYSEYPTANNYRTKRELELTVDKIIEDILISETWQTVGRLNYLASDKD